MHLYSELARLCPVDVVALVEGNEPAVRRELAPGLTEVRVPKSDAHTTAEAQLSHQTGVPVTDVAFGELHQLTPAFAAAVAASTVPGCVLVASHPYSFPALRLAGKQFEYWYDSHNVEFDLKAPMLPSTRVGKRLLDGTRAVERDCCSQASLVLASSSEDAQRLRALYRVSPERVMVIPNGVDARSIRFTLPSQRRELRARLRLARPLALFIGSWHEPNLAAVRQVFELAARLPDVAFAVAGSVGIPLASEPRPANVELFGTVSDQLKDALLTVAEVALNPMLHGSGTNMKMLDYLAAGIPVISTEIGARGLGFDPVEDLRTAALDAFAPAVRDALQQAADRADARALAVRRKIDERLDWSAVAAPLVARLAQPSDHAVQSPVPRSATSA